MSGERDSATQRAKKEVFDILVEFYNRNVTVTSCANSLTHNSFVSQESRVAVQMEDPHPQEEATYLGRLLNWVTKKL